MALELLLALLVSILQKIILLLFSFTLCALAQNKLYLNVGYQKVIPAKNIVRVSVGNPNIADVTVVNKGQEIIITAIKAGSTSLHIWKENNSKSHYIIKVGKQLNTPTLSQQLKQLENIKTIHIQKRSGQYIIKGKLFKTQELAMVENIKNHHNNIIDLSQFNPKSLERIQKLLQTKIHQYHFSNIFVERDGRHFNLKGYVSNKYEKNRVMHIAKSLYPLIQDKIGIHVSKKSAIFIDIKFLEIHSSAIKNIGLDWPSAISTSARLSLNNSVFQSVLNTQQNLNLTLNALSENGKAKVLSNPKILCRDGFTSSFLAGGEIPIRLISERVANVIFKPYGVSLKIKPKVYSSNNILLDLAIKVSDLDSSVSIEGIPGIIEHHLNTSAQTQLNETIVLGGFFQNRLRKNLKRFPLLGTVPIIGELFKSRSFQKKESEFFILLTAHSSKTNKTYHKKLLQQSKTQTVNAQEYNFSLFD